MVPHEGTRISFEHHKYEYAWQLYIKRQVDSASSHPPRRRGIMGDWSGLGIEPLGIGGGRGVMGHWSGLGVELSGIRGRRGVMGH